MSHPPGRWPVIPTRDNLISLDDDQVPRGTGEETVDPWGGTVLAMREQAMEKHGQDERIDILSILFNHV